MALDGYANLAVAVVQTAPTPPGSGTSLTLVPGMAAQLPAPPFNATVWPAATVADWTNAEIVRVTAIVGNTVTLVRNAEPGPATGRAIVAGDYLAATFTAKWIADLTTAGNLTGTLPDARLSANVALRAGGNTFTGNQTVNGLTVLNGLLNAFGFGTHAFSATGAGAMDLAVRNAAAGATNQTRLAVGNDTDPFLTTLVSYASTFTGAAFQPANGSLLLANGAGGLVVNSAAAIRLFTQSAERLRIAPTGELLVNTITNTATAQTTIAFLGGTGTSGLGVQNTNVGNTGFFAIFVNSAGAQCGAIQQTAAATVAFVTTSDARLKQDRGRATDLTALRAVVVHDFTWKADGSRDRGVFAQEAAAVFPRAMTEGTDATTEDGLLAQPWMTDYSKFVADLIVGWQQHDAAITALRAEVAALRQRLDGDPAPTRSDP